MVGYLVSVNLPVVLAGIRPTRGISELVEDEPHATPQHDGQREKLTRRGASTLGKPAKAYFEDLT